MLSFQTERAREREMRIAFISCGKTKKPGFHPACEIYSSPLSRLAWQYTSSRFDQVYILSAKYGLLRPEDKIHSYDYSLREFTPKQRIFWAKNWAPEILKVINDDDELFFFCGVLYRKRLIEILSATNKCQEPLKGISFGKQLQWYNRALESPET